MYFNFFIMVYSPLNRSMAIHKSKSEFPPIEHLLKLANESRWESKWKRKKNRQQTLIRKIQPR